MTRRLSVADTITTGPPPAPPLPSERAGRPRSHRPPLDTMAMWPATAALPEQLDDVAGARSRHRSTRRVPERLGRRFGRARVGRRRGVRRRDAVPLVAHDAGPLPGWVGSGTAVVLLDDARSDEAAGWVAQALEVGARPVVLGAPVADVGADVLSLPEVPAPRVAFGSAVLLSWRLLHRLGALEPFFGDLAQQVEQLAARREQLVGTAAHRGSSPATRSHLSRRPGRTPSRRAGGPAVAPASVNQNAKAPAFAVAEPAACHAEAAGFGQAGDVTRQLLTMVTLWTGHESATSTQRLEAMSRVLDEVMADVLAVRASTAGPVAPFFELVLFADLVSLHLAAQVGLDPGPVPVLDDLARPGG